MSELEYGLHSHRNKLWPIRYSFELFGEQCSHTDAIRLSAICYSTVPSLIFALSRVASRHFELAIPGEQPGFDSCLD